MFISDTHLPQCLPAEAYRDTDWYGRELNDVLLSHWHLLATIHQFKKEGSFVTRELFGHPLLLRKQDGEIRGFLNVCAHRFSRVEIRECGHSDVIRCPYHGWEYDGVTGDTRKIPDAPSFRPLKKGELGLKGVRVETCGGLVFVCLEENVKPLKEYLGDLWDILEARTGSESAVVAHTVDRSVCNWKIALENTLESYHVGFVHKKYLGDTPQEVDCTHQMRPDWTYFEGPGNESKLFQVLQQFLLNRIGKKSDIRYSHTFAYPTLTFGRVDGVTIFWVYIPVDVDHVELRTIVFCYQADSGLRRFWNLGLRLLAKGEAMFWRNVVNQDMALLPDIYRGAKSPSLPSSGLISRREERIPHFQKWILQQMGENISEVSEPDTRNSVCNN